MACFLAIDYGAKRVGLAISDPEGRVAVPLETFERGDDRRAARIASLPPRAL